MLDEEIKIEDKIEELLRMTADKRYRELKLQDDAQGTGDRSFRLSAR